MKLIGKVIYLLTAVTLALILLFGFFPAKAQDDGVNLHVLYEVSSDGVTWCNYAGTENPGGCTLTAQPGGTIYIRFSIFNNGLTPTPRATISNNIVNTSYLTFTTVEYDSDHDGNSFTGSFFNDTNTVNSPALPAGMVEANAQSLTGTAILSSSFPVGTTNITGLATITGYALIAQLHSNLAFTGIAQAAGMNRTSSFLTAVNVPAPSTSSDTTQTTTTSEELPSTGCDCLN